MSREDIVAIASRLFAIFVALYALSLLTSTFQVLATNQITSGAFAGIVAVLLVMLVVALLLWFFPLTIARKLLPVMKEPRSEQSIGFSNALSLALTIMGFWLLTKAMVDSVYWLILLAQVHEAPNFEWSPDQKASIAATGIRLLLSLWLIFGAVGINRLISRLKYAGSGQGAL